MMVELETEAVWGDVGRDHILSFVTGSQLLILFWTFPSLEVPMRAKVVLVQKKLDASFMIQTVNLGPCVDCC